jgi:NTE family protein
MPKGSTVNPSPRTTPRIALALAGGGPLGAIYEIGALCALDECLQGLDLNACADYIGVSAGAFIAAGLANGISPRNMCKIFIEDSLADEDFQLDALLRPAWSEISGRAARLPELLGHAMWAWGVQGKSFGQVLENMGAALPTGLLDNEAVQREIESLLTRKGRSNDFRKLKASLTLVATDLDSGEAAPFGQPGWDHVPISRAIVASAALPGLFPPVMIDERYYADGALKKTLHASVLLDSGVDLMICLNPLVPFHANQKAARHLRIPSLIDGGLPVVLNQTFRSLIHSRLELGMKHYEQAYPNTDILLLEPDHRDPTMFFANTFSYRQRRELAEHAYQHTRQWLRLNFAQIAPVLARSNIHLNMEILHDEHRKLIRSSAASMTTTRRLHETLDTLESIIKTRILRAPKRT